LPNVSSKKAKEANLIGAAGVCFVAGELMVRGMNVSWPFTDEGWDLMTANGCRIQVKTARLRNIPKWSSEPCYSFHFNKRRFMALSSQTMKERAPQVLSERSDIVVLVGLEQKRYWIVPSESLDKVHCAYVGPTVQRSFENDIPHMLDMVKFGFSQKEIGQYYGINQSSVYERLQQAGKPKAAKKYVGLLRSYESEWNRIVDFGKPAIYTTDSAVEPIGVEAERLED